MKKLLLVLAFLAVPGLASAATLTWTDNANNELGTKIEREAVACTAPDAFTEIATVGANVTTYLDSTTVVGNQYCYRVRAYNNSLLDGTGVIQYSGYSNKAGIAYPLAAPNAASGLGVAP